MGRRPLSGEAKVLSKIKRLQWERNYQAPQRRVKRGVEMYQRVMKDFYMKSHRLACYRQLIRDMKGIKENTLYVEPREQNHVLYKHKIQHEKREKLRKRKRDYEISPRWIMKIAR